MRFGNRGSRLTDARRYAAFRPWRERLEDRVLLAIDLGGVPPSVGLPNVATINSANTPPGPFGLVEGGTVTAGGAGFQVRDVGNINGTGYDSFFIGAPSVTTNSIGNVVLGGSATNAAYLVFGSTQVSATTVANFNWQLLDTKGQRVGDLSQLGNTTQTNPIPVAGLTNFPYAGIKFVNNVPGSMLGASVSSVMNINGGNALLIGAPNYPGGGRAYLVYTNAALNGLAGMGTSGNNVVNLDAPTQPGLIVVTFLNTKTTASTTLTGAAVTGLNNFFANGVPAIAIGAPGATIPNSGLVSSGAVYVLPATSIPVVTSTIDLNNVGQSTLTTPTPVPGVLFLGTVTAGTAGFSLADAGDINGVLVGGTAVDDLLIGAPGTGSGGTAYLIYGSASLLTLATPNVNNLFAISLGLIGSSGVYNGAVFNGLSAGSNTGFSVAAAGDFNADGFPDLMIGSPGNSVPTLAGQVTLIYGKAQTSSSPGVFGTINLSSLPTNIQAVTFVGPSLGALAGFSESSLGRLRTGSNFPNDNLLIGAPGFLSNQGAVYLIPGDPTTLLGTFTLADGTQPVAATQITITNTVGAPFLGASVSGGAVATGQTTTIDNSGLAGMILGAPGFNVTGVTTGGSTNTLAGGAFILQGALVPVNIPINVGITTQIGVGVPISTTGVFTVNGAAATLNIFVFSNATISPPFAPVTQILPGSIKVNGVAFPNATIAQDPVDENKDGIPDAIITIAPVSALNLTTATTSLTITGLTRPTGANANKTWGGTASIIVTGVAPPFVPSTPTAVAVTAVPTISTTFVPHFGPDTYVPTVAALSAYNSYKPIPLGVAYNQYLPPVGFRGRIKQFFFPTSHVDQFGSRKEDSGARTSTLGRAVFTRGKFKPGKTISFTHEVPVIPVQEQHQTFIPTPNPKLVAKRSLA
jgi:hypothetical protein